VDDRHPPRAAHPASRPAARSSRWLFWAGASGYVILVVLVAAGVLDRVDHAVLHATKAHRNDTLRAAAGHVTEVFSPASDAAFLGLGAAAIAYLRRRPGPFIIAAVTGWVMAAIVLLTKVSMGRHLPEIPVAPDDGGSFPSGHTASFLVCFGALALIGTTRHRGWRVPLLVAVGAGTAVVAAALVYAGSHWMTDTIGSALLGVAVLALLARYLSRGRP